MRALRLALCAACLAPLGLRGADEEQQKQQPEEIPDFNRIDEYTYLPKSTLSLASRLFINGPRVSYSGQGAIPSPVNPGDQSTVGISNISRTYYDGSIGPDARQITTTTGIGQSQFVPIAPDGRTNTWSYDYPSQLQPNGNLTMSTYSGEVTDTGIHAANGLPNLGLELLMDRDMGKIGKRMKWAITAGFSIADIHSGTYASVPTVQTTTTDTYDLFGQVPPVAPYSSPNTISQTVVNANGQPVTTIGGSTSTQSASQVTLIGNVPIGRTIVPSDVLSTNRYYIEGAYYTLRVGPTLIVPFGNHLKLTMSAGPDFIFSGSELNVLESMPVEENVNLPITDQFQKINTRIVPGYYVDVDLRYDLTESSGFYVGNLYEGAGGYTQSVSSGAGTAYTTKIDFANQDGVKGGFTFRF